MEWLDGEGLLLSVLWSIGYTVKHKTKIPNIYIPFILLAVASALKYLEDSLAGLIFGEAPSLSTAVWAVVYGIQYTFFACGGYEAVRAAKLTWQKRRVKEKKMDYKKKPFVIFLIAFLVATVEFFAVSLIFGSGFFMAFAKITDGWIFGILLLMAMHLVYVIWNDREKITPVYIAMQVLLYINVISFAFASVTANRMFSLIGLAVSVFTGILAGVLPYLVSLIKAKRDQHGTHGKALNEASVQSEWSRTRKSCMNLAPEKKIAKLEKKLAFKLNGDSFYNGIDMNRPLLEGLVDDKPVAVTVAVATQPGKSEELGITAEDIEQAKLYIEQIVR